MTTKHGVNLYWEAGQAHLANKINLVPLMRDSTGRVNPGAFKAKLRKAGR